MPDVYTSGNSKKAIKKIPSGKPWLNIREPAPLVNNTLKRLAPRLLAPLLRLLFASLRVSLSGPAAAVPDLRRGLVFAFWHGKMLTGWLLAKRLFPGSVPAAVVSLSPDGQILTETLDRFGFRLIRGSSSRGRESVREGIADELAQGGLVAVTPDGPRGPLHRFKYGTVRIASEQHSPILFASITYGSARTLGSWDRFEIPAPFSRVEVALHLIDVPAFETEDALRRFADNLSDHLDHA